MIPNTPTYINSEGKLLSRVNVSFPVHWKAITWAIAILISMDRKPTKKAIWKQIKAEYAVNGMGWLDITEDIHPDAVEHYEDARKIAEELYPKYFKKNRP